MGTTYVGFSDESSYCQDECGSISLVTLEERHLADVSQDFHTISKGLSEIKFSGVKSNHKYNIVKNLIDRAIEYMKQGNLRIDTLIWKRIGKCDICIDVQTLSWMMDMLYTNVLKRYPSGSDWILYPDVHSRIN